MRVNLPTREKGTRRRVSKLSFSIKIYPNYTKKGTGAQFLLDLVQARSTNGVGSGRIVPESLP
jgi:hypothetical protein